MDYIRSVSCVIFKKQFQDSQEAFISLTVGMKSENTELVKLGLRSGFPFLNEGKFHT